MVRTRRGLGKEAYAYWQKHGFDKKLRAELNWEASEYRKYEEEQHKKQHSTLVENSQESSWLLKQLGRLILIILQQEFKNHTDTGLVQWHFVKSTTTRKTQLLIRRLPFQRLVREIAQEFKMDL